MITNPLRKGFFLDKVEILNNIILDKAGAGKWLNGKEYLLLCKSPEFNSQHLSLGTHNSKVWLVYLVWFVCLFICNLREKEKIGN